MYTCPYFFGTTVSKQIRVSLSRLAVSTTSGWHQSLAARRGWTAAGCGCDCRCAPSAERIRPRRAHGLLERPLVSKCSALVLPEMSPFHPFSDLFSLFLSTYSYPELCSSVFFSLFLNLYTSNMLYILICTNLHKSLFFIYVYICFSSIMYIISLYLSTSHSSGRLSRQTSPHTNGSSGWCAPAHLQLYGEPPTARPQQERQLVVSRGFLRPSAPQKFGSCFFSPQYPNAVGAGVQLIKWIRVRVSSSSSEGTN